MGQKILIIEDNKDIRDLFSEILKTQNFEVTEAVNGQEGITYAMQGGFALILLDLIMPKKDGISFLEEYRAQSLQSKNGRIVVTSSLGQDATIKRCLELGASGFLIKSKGTPETFLAEINKHLAPQST